MPCGDIGLGQLWFWQSLVACPHQTITWTDAVLSFVWSIRPRAVSQEIPKIFTLYISLKRAGLWFQSPFSRTNELIHWGRATHICVGKLTIIGSDNGLSPGRRQAIIWTNAGILLIGPLGTNFNEILIGIQTFSFKKMHLNVSSAKWRPCCLGLNVLISCVKPDSGWWHGW